MPAGGVELRARRSQLKWLDARPKRSGSTTSLAPASRAASYATIVRGSGSLAATAPNLESTRTSRAASTCAGPQSRRPTKGAIRFGATSEQRRPNNRENRASSGTRRRSQALRNTTLYGLQNLHPRFKSGRRLQISSSIQSFVHPWHERMPTNWTTVDLQISGLPPPPLL